MVKEPPRGDHEDINTFYQPLGFRCKKRRSDQKGFQQPTGGYGCVRAPTNNPRKNRLLYHIIKFVGKKNSAADSKIHLIPVITISFHSPLRLAPPINNPCVCFIFPASMKSLSTPYVCSDSSRVGLMMMHPVPFRLDHLTLCNN